MRTTTVNTAGKAIAISYWFASESNPNRPPHETLVWDDGTVSCNCPGWTRQCVHTANGIVRSCRHTRLVLSKQAERYASSFQRHSEVTIRVAQDAPKNDPNTGAERLFDFTND